MNPAVAVSIAFAFNTACKGESGGNLENPLRKAEDVRLVNDARFAAYLDLRNQGVGTEASIRVQDSTMANCDRAAFIDRVSSRALNTAKSPVYPAYYRGNVIDGRKQRVVFEFGQMDVG